MTFGYYTFHLASYKWLKIIVLSDSLLIVNATKSPANLPWEIKIIVENTISPPSLFHNLDCVWINQRMLSHIIWVKLELIYIFLSTHTNSGPLCLMEHELEKEIGGKFYQGHKLQILRNLNYRMSVYSIFANLEERDPQLRNNSYGVHP